MPVTVTARLRGLYAQAWRTRNPVRSKGYSAAAKVHTGNKDPIHTATDCPAPSPPLPAVHASAHPPAGDNIDPRFYGITTSAPEFHIDVLTDSASTSSEFEKDLLSESEGENRFDTASLHSSHEVCAVLGARVRNQPHKVFLISSLQSVDFEQDNLTDSEGEAVPTVRVRTRRKKITILPQQPRKKINI